MAVQGEGGRILRGKDLASFHTGVLSYTAVIQQGKDKRRYKRGYTPYNEARLRQRYQGCS